MTISAKPSEEVVAGSTVTLTCLATLDPYVDTDHTVQITWDIPNSMPINGDVYVEDGSGVHYSSNITISDIEMDGLYKCTVEILSQRNNILGAIEYKNTTLRVDGKSKIVVCDTATIFCLSLSLTHHLSLSPDPPPPPHVEIEGPGSVTAGNSLTLTCTVTSASKLTLTAPPVVELIMGGIVEVGRSSDFTLTYTVETVRATDGGQYLCKATLYVEGLAEPLLATGGFNLVVISKS